MNRGSQLIAVTVLVVVIGAALIKGCDDGASSNPVASVTNGAPRGLLALSQLVAKHGGNVVVRTRFDDKREALPPAGTAVVVVPPPELSAWTQADVTALLERVKAGDRVLVLCDDDEEPRTHKLAALLEAVGVTCARVDVPIGDESATRALGTMPRYRRTLSVRGEGRAKANDKAKAPVFPAFVVGSDDLVVKRAFGKGLVTVVGSATIFANDGIVKADNAAFALDELLSPVDANDGKPPAVIFDERHHASRSRAAFLQQVARGTGPWTALIALLLLVPLSLLSLAPRPGDPPPDDDDNGGAPAAEAQARALAALLQRRKR